jgi:hypothetical protein
MNIKKWAGYTLGALGILSGFLSLYLEMQYGASRPRSPQPNAGRVIAMNDHGTLVFLTGSENGLLWALRIGGITLVASGGILEIWARKKKAKGDV